MVGLTRHFNSKDIMIIAAFSVLSAIALLLTNFINLVALTGIAGANGIYTQFFTCLFLWIGVLLVRKKFVVTVISTSSALVGLIVPGGPMIAKPILLPYSIVTGLIVDLIILKFRFRLDNKLASLFGVLRASHVLVVQKVFGVPLELGLPFFVLASLSGAMGGVFATKIYSLIDSSKWKT